MAEPESEVIPETETEVEPGPEGELEPEFEPEYEPEFEPEFEPEGTAEPWGAAEEESPVEPEAAAEFTDGTAVIWVSLYSLCMLLIIFGDSLVIYSILRKRALRRKEANIYLLSLIFARTMIGFFVVPVRISAIYSEEYLGSVLCKLCHWSALGSLTTSIVSMLSVAICKYKDTMARKKAAIITTNAFMSKPNDSKDKQNSGSPEVKADSVKPFVLRVVGFWLLGHVYAIRVPFLFDLLQVERNGETIWSCRLNLDYDVPNKAFIVVDFVCLFMMPLSIVLYCYVRILSNSSLTTILKNAFNPKKSKAENESEASALEKSIKEEKKTSLMLIIVMSLFIVCNLPPNAIKIYSLLGGKNGAAITNTTEQVVYLASYSNSWLNVLVYILFRDDIRQSLREIFSRCCFCIKGGNAQVAPAAAASAKPVVGFENDQDQTKLKLADCTPSEEDGISCLEEPMEETVSPEENSKQTTSSFVGSVRESKVN